MWFFLVWSQATRLVKVGQGYFNCPHCRHRRPCLLSQLESRWYLYGLIPMPGRKRLGPESYQCLGCRRDWSSEAGLGYDFGEHLETPNWKCFKCSKEVPYESFECPHCGYRLEVDGRF
jgi:DNA-directed RNA polymerase subunit RPC12/RpoP